MSLSPSQEYKLVQLDFQENLPNSREGDRVEAREATWDGQVSHPRGVGVAMWLCFNAPPASKTGIS